MPTQRHETHLEVPITTAFAALVDVVARGRWGAAKIVLDAPQPRAGCEYAQQRGSVDNLTGTFAPNDYSGTCNACITVRDGATTAVIATAEVLAWANPVIELAWWSLIDIGREPTDNDTIEGTSTTTTHTVCPPLFASRTLASWPPF